MQMGIKRDRRSLWVGLSHCWSNTSGSSVVLSAVVSRPHLGSNQRTCPRFGSVTARSQRISRSVVRFSLSNLYADSKGAGHANRCEKGGTSQSCPWLFRAKRCDAKTTRFDLTVLSRAIPCEGHRLESNEEVAEVCDLIFGAGYDHPFEGISPGHVPEKDWLSFLKNVKHAPNINPEEGKAYIDAADRWRQDHGYSVPPDDAGYVSLVERTLLR